MKHLFYVEADITNGVVREQARTEFCAEVVDQEAFYDALKNLADDQMIGAFIDQAMYDKIKAVYGISWPPRMPHL